MSAPARDLLRWLAAGLVLGAAVIVVAGSLHLLVGWPQALTPTAIGAAVLPVVALAAGSSKRIAHHGGRALVDVLAVASFTVVICSVYLVIVRGLGNPPSGYGDRQTLGLSMLAAALAAVTFGPSRRAFVRSANRLVFGTRKDPDDLVRAVAGGLTRHTTMEELLLQLAESLVRSMALTRAEVYTGSGQILERTAGVPDRTRLRSVTLTDKERLVVLRAPVSGTAWVEVWLPGLAATAEPEAEVRVAPIRNAGQLLGLLVVERSRHAEPFSEDDDRVLGDLAREVGLALHNMHLDAALQDTLVELRAQASELRESRARIVASGDAERRRVERNLHDGAQQSLVALAIGLRIARDLLDTDVAEAARMLDQLNADAQDAVRELREVAHGIYPPLLADSGLSAALQAAAARYPLPVEVEVSTPDRYDQDTEAAVYFCCLEALQNAAKHAPGSSVRVRVWADDTTLSFQVRDDGPGFDVATTPKGQGLLNMTDRLGAIGGTVRWTARAGWGAEVAGDVPINPSRS